MKYDTTKVDEGFDWDAMDRLHAQGFIPDPKSKAKSVILTAEGERRAAELFRRYFVKAV